MKNKGSGLNVKNVGIGLNVKNEGIVLNVKDESIVHNSRTELRPETHQAPWLATPQQPSHVVSHKCDHQHHLNLKFESSQPSFGEVQSAPINTFPSALAIPLSCS